MNDTVICATCGKVHPVSESELTFKLPDVVFAIDAEERESRCTMNSDIVILDGNRFFIRGLLPLSVMGRDHPYNLGVWTEVNEPTFARIYELWDEEDQDAEPRMPGHLANGIPFHTGTVGLGVTIQLTGPKSRPQFYLDAFDHSLYVEQSGGIDEHRAIEYSEHVARKGV